MARSRDEITAKFTQILEYMDGPQVILLERSSDFKIVAVAIEKAGEPHPFFGSAISYDQWERYRRGMVDLRYLFIFPRWRQWFFLNLKASSGGEIALQRTAKDEYADEHYIPDAFFFSYDHSEPIKYLGNDKLSTQKYVTDGVWDLPDFTEFYHKLTDIYVFSLSLKKYQESEVPLDDKRNIRDSFLGHPLRGGSSYVNLYTDLASTQGLGERLSVGRLQYASAGHVDVRGRFDIFEELRATFERMEENYEGIKEQYHLVYEYLRRNKLLRADPERFDKESPVARYIYLEGNKLAKTLAVHDVELIFTLTDQHALKFAKIILSYFRRVERYFMFFAEGRVKNPEIVETN